MMLTLRSFTAVPVVFALCAASFATAPAKASTPGRSFFHHTATSSVRPQYVVLEFRNASPQQRAVQIGEDQYSIAPNSRRKLSVAVGSIVKVRSDVNSKVDGNTLLKVTDPTPGQTIEVN